MIAITDDLFLMANLSPLFTGLPFVVWISARGHARHDIGVKISRGSKATPEKLISLALRPQLRVIGRDKLAADELEQLRQWVTLNWDTLLAYWNGEMFTEQAIAQLKPITVVQPGPPQQQ
jgi:hypothetical protein